MKKTSRILALLFALMTIAGIFASCGASSKSDAGMAETAPMAPMEPAEPSAPALDYTSGNGFADYEATMDSASTTANPEADNASLAERKLIYTYDLYIETLDYNAATAGLPALATEFGGYVESSYVEASGINYERTYRFATYTLRIPSERVASFVTSCGELGVITSQYCDTDDKTAAYIDLSARLETLEIEEETLNGLLAKADSVDTIVALNARLSEVRYEIESIESSLRSIDSLVQFSTVNIELQEVTKVTTVENQAPKTFGERLSSRLSRTYENFIEEIEDIGIYLLGEFPLQLVLFLIYIIPFVIIAIVILLVIRALRRRRKAKKAAKAAPAIPADANDDADEPGEPEA